MCFSIPFQPMLPLQKKTIPRKSAHLQAFLNYFYTKAITNSESITYIYTQILQHLFVNQCQILFRIYICVFHEPTSSPMKCFKQRSSPSNLIIQFDLDLKLNNQYQCITFEIFSSTNTVAEPILLSTLYFRTRQLTLKLLGLTMVQSCASVVGVLHFAVGLVTVLLIIKYKNRFVNYNMHRFQ